MLEHDQSNRNNSQKIVTNNRETGSNSNSSVPYTIVPKASTTIAEKLIKKKYVIRGKDKTQPSSNGGNIMVDRKSATTQWETNDIVNTRSDSELRCFTGGMGAACKGERAGGKFTWEEKQKLTHINELEISAALKTIQTFYRIHKPRTMHLKIDNLTALSYIIKMGGKSNQKMNQISKQIWEFMMKNKCQLTAEYIPSKLNIEADQESRAKDCSEWKLNPQIFQTICNKMGKPEIDLFTSLATHQLTKYMSWKPDPKAIAVNALQTSWTHTFPYAFPPFKLIGKTLNKIRYHHISAIIVTPLWPSAPWYPMLIQMAIKYPLFLPTTPTLLTDPMGIPHPLLQAGKLKLAAWLVSGQDYKIKEYQSKLQNYSLKQEPEAQQELMNQPGYSMLAGVTNNKKIRFTVI